MNSSEKCCFCVDTKVGVVSFGVGSLIIFKALALTSGVLLGLEHEQSEIMIASAQFKVISLNAILVAVLVMSVLGLLFTVVLLIGIFKRIPGLVLSYFGFGVMNTILMMLGSLLFLLHSYWYISFICFLITIFYIYFVTLMYTVYDTIQKGNFDSNLDDQMDDQLLNVE